MMILIDCWCLTSFQQYDSYITATVLLVEETGVPEENHRPWARNW